jgi:hypothetical protein
MKYKVPLDFQKELLDLDRMSLAEVCGQNEDRNTTRAGVGKSGVVVF